MNSEFSNWYRAKFNQLDENPPKEVWENISNELDIEEVWTNVDYELRKRSRRKAIIRFISYSGILLLLLGSGILFFFHQPDFMKSTSLVQYQKDNSNNNSFNEKKYISLLETDNTDKKAAVHKNKITSRLEVNNNKTTINKNKINDNLESNINDKKIAIHKKNAPSLLEVNNNKTTVNKNKITSHIEVNSNDKKTAVNKNIAASNYSSNKTELLSVRTANSVSQSLNENKKQIKNSNNFLTETNSNLVDLKTNTSLINGEIKQDVFDSIISPKNTSSALYLMVPLQIHLPEKKHTADSSIEYVSLPNNPQMKFLTIGTAFTYYNSWLLNNDTYEGFNKNNLNQTNLSFGNSYATLLGYDLSDIYSLQTEWSINNKQEQNYIRYHEGKEVHKKIEINYTHFNLLVKKKKLKFVFKKRIPLSLNYIAGIQYGHIKSVTNKFNDKTRLITNRFRKNNYSLVLGVEYQLTIKQLWVISSGLRADIGIRNIYAGNSIMPASFNRTYNSSIGLNLGINYIIPIKRKK